MPTTPDAQRISSLEAERAYLGSILLDPHATTNGNFEPLIADNFYSTANRTIYQTMLEIRADGREIEFVGLCERLSNKGLLEKAGGAAYLSNLTDGVPVGTSVAFSEYARIIREKYKSRQLLNSLQNLIARANEGTDSAEELLELANAQIQDLRVREVKAADASGKLEVIGKAEPEPKKAKAKVENIYPLIRKDAWHSAAELYLKAHEHCTEGSNNWHFITFYTAIGALLGRILGTRMGGMIYGNLYSVLVGQIGGDGKDTVADFGTDFMRMIDDSVHIPEDIASKAGFCKEWSDFIARRQIGGNNRCLLRLPEIRTYLDTAEQSGTKSITPMLLTHYAPRPALDNGSVNTTAHIPYPHFAMLACGAKRFIGQIPEGDLINGLGRRVCFVPGDPKGPNPDPDPPDMEMLTPLADNIRESLNMYSERKDGWRLPLSKESKKLWDSWYKVYWKRKRGDDLLAALNNGDRVTCRKIALINAFLDRETEAIKPSHLEPAMAFGEFLYECRYPIFSEHGANPYVEIEKKILDKIPEFPNRVLKRWLQRYLRSIDTKTFNDRLKYMSMDDGPITIHRDGKRVYISRAE